MHKLAGIALVLIALAPLAAAQDAPEATLPTDVPSATVVTEGAETHPVRDALAGAGSAAASAASALGNGLSTAAGLAASTVKAIGHGIAATFAFVGRLLASLGSALASVVQAIGALLVSLVKGLAALLITGAISSAAVVRAHPKESAIVAGSAAGAGGILYLLKRLGLGLGLALPLYTRLAPGEMLDNEARAAVYAHIKQNPGAHPSAIAETLHLGWGTVVYHLARLESSKLVTVREGSHRKCYFAVGGSLGQDERTAIAAMSTDKAKAIVHVVRAAPGITQKDLAERLGMSQALASWHVKRLIGSGVLLSAKEGRSNCLRVAEHVPIMGGVPAPVAVAVTVSA